MTPSRSSRFASRFGANTTHFPPRFGLFYVFGPAVSFQMTENVPKSWIPEQDSTFTKMCLDNGAIDVNNHPDPKSGPTSGKLCFCHVNGLDLFSTATGLAVSLHTMEETCCFHSLPIQRSKRNVRECSRASVLEARRAQVFSCR